jgi:hypothetical protein
MKYHTSIAVLLVACLTAVPQFVRADHGVPDRLEKLEAAIGHLSADHAHQCAEIAALKTDLAAAKAKVAALEAALQTVAGSSVLQLTPFVQVQSGLINGLKGPHIVFTGVNLHVRSGSGSSGDGVEIQQPGTGLGNLIVGYNEWPGTDDPAPSRTGSHCLVIGAAHTYVAPIGIVAGYGNKLAEGTSSVLGGSGNSATSGSAILGGYMNKTDNSASPGWHFTHQCISGGGFNTVEGWADSVTGGWGNNAQGSTSVVSGGSNNRATAFISSVSGGQNNTASGTAASVSGGSNREATGGNNWVAGALIQEN